MTLKIMTLEEAIDHYSKALDEYIQECPWTASHWSTDKALDLLCRLSLADGYILADMDFYDEILQNVYECTEKGLS